MFEEFLQRIAPYVVICGSFANGTEKEESDIDCFLRSRPINEVDPEISNDTYMPEILAIIKEYGFITDSVLIGHIAVEKQLGVPRMVEISSHYRIPYQNQLFYRDIYGVQLLCGQDNKDIDQELCYDAAVWSDDISDMIIPHPIPQYKKAGD